MNKPQRVISIFVVFGIFAAIAYWIYLYISEGEAPSFSDLWTGAKGGITAVTGIGKLNFSDLQTLASQAGFPDPSTAAAIALAESSGNPSAVGDLDITPGGSIGLWQINLKAHPEYNAAELTDPATNASAAFAVFSAAGGFHPWSTFNSGAYIKYLPQSASDTVAQNDTSADDETASYGASS